MTTTIPAGSLEYVRVAVEATVSGVAYDPTSDAVKMAFMPGAATPTAGDLKTAVWETDTSTNPHTYRAMCLVGPGGTVTLAAGSYRVWVQVTDSPEIPLRPAGTLKVV